MATFAEKYTHWQREAIAEAVVDRQIPSARVVEMAGAGTLVDGSGRTLPPFETNASTVRSYARQLRKRRTGEAVSRLGLLPHRDAIEILRQRLMTVSEQQLAAHERALRREPDKADPERLRQIIRCVREAAALPGPEDPRPPAPGERVAGLSNGGDTRGGLGGAMLAAAGIGRATPTLEPLPPPPALEPPAEEPMRRLRQRMEEELARDLQRLRDDGEVADDG